jgi:hypothetical protein
VTRAIPSPANNPAPTSAVRAPRFSATQPMTGAASGTLPMKTITYSAAMRPRIAGVDVIWIIAFAVVARVRMLRPTSGSTAR